MSLLDWMLDEEKTEGNEAPTLALASITEGYIEVFVLIEDKSRTEVSCGIGFGKLTEDNLSIL